MKKKFLLVLMFLGMFFISGTDVFALTCEVGESDCSIEKVFEEMKNPICIYEVTIDDKKYYNILGYDIGSNYINFTGGSTIGLPFGLVATDDFASSGSTFISKDAIAKLKEEGKCPTNSYLDTSGTSKAMCFDNKDACQKGTTMFNDKDKEKNQTSKLITDTRYNLAHMIIPLYKYKNVAINKACDVNEDSLGFKACRYISENQTGNNVILYYNEKWNFISVYDSETGNRYIATDKNPYIRIEYAHMHGNVGAKRYTYTNNINGNISACPSKIYFYKETSNFYYYYATQQNNNKLTLIEAFKEESCHQEIIEPEPGPELEGCEGLIKGNLREYLNFAMSIPRIGVPILLIGLLIYDLATAMFSGSDDKMAKTKSKAIKRIIIAVIIFFVPTFMNLIFDLVNEVWNKNFEICEFDK